MKSNNFINESNYHKVTSFLDKKKILKMCMDIKIRYVYYPRLY